MLQVLGHHVRSDIHRPREQLAMPSMADLDFGEGNEEGAVIDEACAWLKEF